jgi:hypothetical protein
MKEDDNLFNGRPKTKATKEFDSSVGVGTIFNNGVAPTIQLVAQRLQNEQDNAYLRRIEGGGFGKISIENYDKLHAFLTVYGHKHLPRISSLNETDLANVLSANGDEDLAAVIRDLYWSNKDLCSVPNMTKFLLATARADITGLRSFAAFVEFVGFDIKAFLDNLVRVGMTESVDIFFTDILHAIIIHLVRGPNFTSHIKMATDAQRPVFTELQRKFGIKDKIGDDKSSKVVTTGRIVACFPVVAIKLCRMAALEGDSHGTNFPTKLCFPCMGVLLYGTSMWGDFLVWSRAFHRAINEKNVDRKKWDDDKIDKNVTQFVKIGLDSVEAISQGMALQEERGDIWFGIVGE